MTTLEISREEKTPTKDFPADIGELRYITKVMNTEF